MTTKRKIVLFFDIGSTLLGDDNEWLPDAKHALAKLRQAGITLGIISNTGALTRAQLIDVLPSDFDLPSFDPLVLLSSEVGFEKPDLRIFELARKRADAKFTLFCTETLAHCLAAQRAGLFALRVNPPASSDIAQLPGIISEAKLLAPP